MLAAAVAVAALVALLGWLSVARLQSISDEEDRLEAQTRVNADLQVQIDQLADARRAQEELEATQRQVEAALATDVSWSRMLNEIARTIPNDTWLTAFQGSVTQAAVPGTPAPQPTPGPEGRPAVTTSSAAGAPTAPATIAGPTGTLSFTAKGLDFPSIAAWITRISEIPSLADLWVPSSTKAELGSREIVDFTSTATITPTARSNRAERLQEQQP
ncbi:MAG: hypothetical protein M5U14_06820 [Acidimicrobiia bacterium]|nr:hypothetical protein [Acidimicrobiia bacterium]